MNKSTGSIKSFSVFDGLLNYYTSEGLNLIPLIHGDKKPAGEWKEHQQRRITKEELDRFFRSGTQHNIGVVCGAISDNLYVLDFDTEEIFHRFFTKTDGLTVVKTGRGYHVYFKAESPVKTLKIHDSEGREIATLKGEGSYVVAPPSRHPSGCYYEFIQRGEIPRLQGDARQQINERAIELGLTVPKEKIDIETLLNGASEGNRDNSLTYLIHFLRRSGVSKEKALEICEAWNKRNKPPLEDVSYKVDYHYGLAEPYSYFYSLDPGLWNITDTLTLEKKIDRMAPREEIEEKKDRNYIIFGFEETKPKINHYQLAQDLIEEYHFKTLSDTRDILFYEDGIYRYGGESIIEKECEIRLEGIVKRYDINEIIEHIRRLTFIDRNDLNGDKWTLNLKNGLLNIKTKEFKAHTPELLSTVRIPVKYDPEAKCPEINKFLSEVLYERNIPAVEEMIGYCLYPEYIIQYWFLLHGKGANGKTTLLAVIVKFLGSENVAAVGLQDLNQRFAAASLYGKLANICADLSSADLKSTHNLKALTGGDLINAEEKFKKPFPFVNFAKLIYACNQIPLTEDKSRAFYRRVRIIPFPNTFTGNDADKNLLDKLTTEEELSGLLNLAIAGLNRLLENGDFTGSTSADETKERYEQASNTVYNFFHDCITEDPEYYIVKIKLIEAYRRYCETKDFTHRSAKEFIKEMKALTKMEDERKTIGTGRPRVWLGIKLKEECEEGFDMGDITNY